MGLPDVPLKPTSIFAHQFVKLHSHPSPDFRVKAHLPTNHGNFEMYTFDSGHSEFPHVAMVSGNLTDNDVPLVRIHSECMTGDVFGSQRCDCGSQLHSSMDRIGREGGVLIYLRQEGRGIGLVNKLRAYNLQDEGMDTVEANEALGFHADDRDYAPAMDILHFFKITRIRLMTNNPLKIKSFDESGIEVVERLPIIIAPVNASRAYLETKRLRMGHLPE